MKLVPLTFFILVVSISVWGVAFSQSESDNTKQLEEFLSRLRQGQRATTSKQQEQDSDQAGVIVQKGAGLITSCSYRVGERVCGKCYCLKALEGSVIVFNGRKLRGCARLDISRVGDLANFVGQTVYYEGTSDFDCTFICPQHFKLFTISLLEEEVENSPTAEGK